MGMLIDQFNKLTLILTFIDQFNKLTLILKFIDQFNKLTLILTFIDSMPLGFFHLGYMYPFTFIFGGTSKFLGVQSLTLHLGVQRKLTAFSPCKVVHHAVFCKYYAELAKTFFLSV